MRRRWGLETDATAVTFLSITVTPLLAAEREAQTKSFLPFRGAGMHPGGFADTRNDFLLLVLGSSASRFGFPEKKKKRSTEQTVVFRKCVSIFKGLYSFVF